MKYAIILCEFQSRLMVHLSKNYAPGNGGGEFIVPFVMKLTSIKTGDEARILRVGNVGIEGKRTRTVYSRIKAQLCVKYWLLFSGKCL